MKCTQIIMAALFAGVLLGGCKKDEPSPPAQPSMGPASPVELAPSNEPEKGAGIEKGSVDTPGPEVSAQLEMPRSEKSEPAHRSLCGRTLSASDAAVDLWCLPQWHQNGLDGAQPQGIRREGRLFNAA